MTVWTAGGDAEGAVYMPLAAKCVPAAL